MNEVTLNPNSSSTSGAIQSSIARASAHENGQKQYQRGNSELTRLLHSDQIKTEVAKRLLQLHQKRELSRLVTSCSLEKQMANAMTTIEAYIRVNQQNAD